jgi:hypothetical protein
MPVNSSNLRSEDQEDLGFEASRGKKLARPHLSEQAEHSGACLYPSYVGGLDRRIVVLRLALAKARNLI